MSNKRKQTRKKPSPHFGLRLEPQLREELTRLAAADGRTLSNYVRRVLEQHVAPLSVVPTEPAEEAPRAVAA